MALFGMLKRRFLYRRISSRLLFTKLRGKYFFSGATLLNQRLALRKRLGIFSEAGSELVLRDLFSPVSVRTGKKGTRLRKTKKKKIPARSEPAEKIVEKPKNEYPKPIAPIKPKPIEEPKEEDSESVAAEEERETQEFFNYKDNLKRILELMENLNYSGEDIDIFMQKVNDGSYTWQELQDLRDEFELKFDDHMEDVMDILANYKPEESKFNWNPINMFKTVWQGKIFGQIRQALRNVFSWSWLKENWRFTGLNSDQKEKIEKREEAEATFRKRLKARLGRGLGFQ